MPRRRAFARCSNSGGSSCAAGMRRARWSRTRKRTSSGPRRGAYQKDFTRMWHALFTLAGLDYGRDKGLVWHTTRHEFISRVAENTGDPVLTQELARHKDAKTTGLYTKAREYRKLAAAAGLSGDSGELFGDFSRILFRKVV